MYIPIDSLYPTTGHLPSNAVDGAGISYMAWELLDEAAFNFTVPIGYETGSALNILLKETSESVSLNHKWSVKYTVDNHAAVTLTSQVTCDATPGVIF